jgi:anaerobic selenocysteine-containing dehydrogenase
MTMTIPPGAGTQVVHAACPHDCPDACSMLVTVTDGVATGVRGNPDHPFTRGSLCTKVNDYERHAYDPDRLLYPMRRVGPKGEGEFERISWDDAVSEICGRFRSISAEWGSQAILPISFTGNISLLNGMGSGDPFMHRLGATVLERTMCISTRSTAWFLTNGPAVIDPESVVNSRFIVVWGSNVLTSNQHLWPFIREARAKGAKVVVIDPYRTRTAAQADWFMPIRPGTDGALAFGLIHVLVAEGLVDADYVERHTTGFEDLAERAAAFPPERVEDITGIPAADVRALARDLATVQPSMINVGVAVERGRTGGQAFRAIFCLPALVGSWRHVGGGAIEMPLWGFPVKWDVLSKPEWIRPDTRVVNHLQLGRALTGGLALDPPIKAVLVYVANPAAHVPESDLVTSGLAREDLFTVVHDLYLTDTARYADIVLPATTVLEHFDMTMSWGHTYFQVNNPAIEPIGEAVSNTELFRRLAAGMGFDDDWFSSTDEQMAAAAIDWDAPAAAGLSMEAIRRDGWARINLPPATAAPYAEGGFPTPSGRVEFRSSLIEQVGGPFVLPLFREGYTGAVVSRPLDPVPDWLPPADEGSWPLTLITPKSHAFLNSQYANHRRQRTIEGPLRVMVNPGDAATRSINGGDAVRVFNDLGAFDAVAEIRDDVVAGTLVSTYGRWGNRTSVNSCTPSEPNDMGNGPSLSDARVDIAVRE